MEKIDLNKVLLELALSTRGDFENSYHNLTGLLGNAIPVFIKQLDCYGACVLHDTDEVLQVVYNNSMVGRPGFPLTRIAEELFVVPEQFERTEPFLIIKNDLVYYIFCLKNFGLLILSRETQLHEDFLYRLLPVIALLAHSCYTHLEIDRRREAEQKLQQERNLFYTIINNIPEPIYVKDLEGRKILVNKAEADLLNAASIDEVLGKTDFAFYPPDIAEKTRLEDCRILEMKTPMIHEEGTLVMTTGEKIWVEGNKIPYFDDKGNVAGIVGISHNITNRIKAQKEIKESEEKLGKLLYLQNLLTQLATEFINIPVENSDEAVNKLLTLIGEHNQIDRVYIFRYDFASKTMSNTHEWCAEGVGPEINSLQMIPHSMLPSWVEKHLKGEILEVPDVNELPGDSPLRQILEQQGIKTLITVPMILNGECLGFVGFDSVKMVKKWSREEIIFLRLLADLLCNVVDRKRTEQELKKATEAAEASNMAKTRFLTTMSHEIRTPLNAIIGMIRLFRETRLDQPQLKLLGNMNTASENLLAIINDILDFSKIESGQITLDKIDFNVNELFRRVFDANEYRAEGKNIKLQYSVDPLIPEFLNGDPYRLHQALNNLVSNAVKFTNEGSVELHCKLIGEEQDASRILFVVEDTGIGISPENQKRIFESFHQEDESITRTYGGTGLGLAISRQLVEMMGGELGLESSKSTGSSFYFTLIITKGSAGHSCNTEPSTEHVRSALTGFRILLVEDNKFNQFIAQSMMEKWGAAVILAEDGQQAVNILTSEKFDLILMDIQMPVMDGITAAKMIRNNLKIQTPILALTANVVMGIVEKCEEAGMQGYISKPFEEEELCEKIITLIREGQAQSVVSPPNIPEIVESKLVLPEVKVTAPEIHGSNVADISRLSKMVSHDKAMRNRMILKFLEVTPAYMQALSDAAVHNDYDAVSRMSHKLKSSIDLVSVESLRDLIKRINETSKPAGESENLKAMIDEFSGLFELLVKQLNDLVTVS
jgi:PAS domain S-box-containing protein